jgi:arylsulfatase A-like enzyme
MYRDLDYYYELKSKTEKILNEERLSFEYYNTLTLQEKFSLLVLGLLQRIERRPEAGVYEAARKDLHSKLGIWHKVPGYAKHIQLLSDSYDAGIRYTDFYLGDFFAFLKAQNIWDNTMLIVTSDHGEELMDHNMIKHGIHLYDTLIHIPLIIKMPNSTKQTPMRITGLADLVDLMPTILDVLNIKFNGTMQGQSLLSMIQKKKKKGKSQVYASMDVKEHQKIRLVRTERWKYIIHDMDFSERDELYDFEEDPFERHNLIPGSHDVLPELKKNLTEHIRECLDLFQSKYSNRRKTKEDYPEDLRKERMEVLRALGYIR